MLAYKDLSKEEQDKLDDSLVKDGELKLWFHIRNNHICCRCFMAYYNCVCCHEDL